MNDVFVSYGREDRAFAAALAAEIEGLGGAASCDDDIAPGDAFEDNLRQAIRDADAFVFIVPEEGERAANNAYFQAGAAKAIGKPIIMVVPAGDREIPSNLLNFMCLDARERSVAEVARTLVQALKPALAS